MTKLILIRPGRTAWDEEDIGTCGDCRLQGTLPLPLSPQGKRALAEMAEALQKENAECLYSSGNESSGPTAKYLAKLCRWKSKKVETLRELDCGSWQDLRLGEIKKRFSRAYRQWRNDPANAGAPQGESIQAVYDRVRQGLASILDNTPDQTVVIVAAPIVCGLIECHLTEQPLENLWTIVERKAAMLSFVRDRDQWTLQQDSLQDDRETDSTQADDERTIKAL